jgi:hypothetical protein
MALACRSRDQPPEKWMPATDAVCRKATIRSPSQMASIGTSTEETGSDDPGINASQVRVLSDKSPRRSSGERWTTKHSAQLVGMIGVPSL